MRRGRCLVLSVVVTSVFSGCSGGGGGGPPTFSTSVPGDRPLGGLSDSEQNQLCIDGARFASRSAVRMDNCLTAAFFVTALTAAFSPTSTEADLRMACSNAYDQCLNPAADAGAGSGGGPGATCSKAAPNCTATVAEFAACVNDQAAQAHELASKIPQCSAITKEDLAPSDGGTSEPPGVPASCQLVSSKCSPVSDAARGFIDEYCGLIDPCCAAGGLRSVCAPNLEPVASAGNYDDAAGQACLTSLRARQVGSDFCDGLTVIRNFSSPSWAVSPECAAAFKPPRGTTPPGAPCMNDNECAPGANGDAVCSTDLFGGDLSMNICVQTSTRPSDPCIGTISGFGTSGFGGSPASNVLCDQTRGVLCDSTSQLCVPVRALGDECDGIESCDNVTTYCNLGNVAVHRCEARLPPGADCAGDLFAQCDGDAFCDKTTLKCVPQRGNGAPCSGELTFPPECRSGFCRNGTCTTPLSPLCG